MKKIIVKIFILLLIVLVPFLVFLSVAFFSKPVYSNTYQAKLADKYDTLKNTSGEKIVIVSGSSSVFGLNSEKIESVTGKKVINFGLYAALGTKVVLDLARTNISKGDIYVLYLETSEETLSLNFNYEMVLEALEGREDILREFSFNDQEKLLYSVFPYGLQKYEDRKKAGNTPTAPYNRNCFNVYGDIEFDRPYNILPSYFQDGRRVKVSNGLLKEEFLEYLNEFNACVEKKGGKVIYAFPPINQLAIDDESNYVSFEELLRKNLDFPLAGKFEDSVIDYGFFYDTNYHLNNIGAQNNTIRFLNDLKTSLNLSYEVEGELKEAPLIPVDNYYDQKESNEQVEYFDYRLMNGSYVIKGLKEEYLDLETLIIPTNKDGVSISLIGPYAFRNSKAKEVFIPTNIKEIKEDAFKGMERLEKVYLMHSDPTKIIPPLTGLIEDTDKFMFYIRSEYLNDFKGNYNWVIYKEKLNPFTIKE